MKRNTRANAARLKAIFGDPGARFYDTVARFASRCGCCDEVILPNAKIIYDAIAMKAYHPACDPQPGYLLLQEQEHKDFLAREAARPSLEEFHARIDAMIEAARQEENMPPGGRDDTGGR